MTARDFALTTVVADDTVNMVEWWAARGVETPISGDDLAVVRNERKRAFAREVLIQSFGEEYARLAFPGAGWVA